MGVAHEDPSFLIMSNVVKSKETGNIIRLFPYFTWDYLLKQEAVVVKPPEWKFMAIIATIFEL